MHFAPLHTASYEVVCGDTAFEAMLSRTYPISQDGLRVRSLTNTRAKAIQGDCEVSLVLDRRSRSTQLRG